MFGQHGTDPYNLICLLALGGDTQMTNVIIFFAVFALAVVIGQKLKINAGFVAVAFGFILFWIYGGVDPETGKSLATSSNFIKNFPSALFWNYAIPVLFYAFAAANGTLQKLGQIIAYKFRNARWALPIAVYIIAAVVAVAGAGTMNTAIVAPLSWGLCIAAGVNPMIVPFALWTGSFLGSFVPWTSNGALLTGLYEQNLQPYGIDPMSLSVRICIYYGIMSLIIFIGMFVITKGWKPVDTGNGLVMEKPEPMNKQQKITMTIIIVCILLLLVPAILCQFTNNPVLVFMKNNLGIPITSVAGISLVAVLGGNSIKDVFSKHVNWNIIWLITGMGMYCTLAKPMGVISALGDAIQAMNPSFVMPAIALIGSMLSFVTSASTVQPMLFAMVPALSQGSGITMTAISTAMMIGVAVTSMSPISTGGALCLVGATEEAANKLFPRMILAAVLWAIVFILLAFTPFYSIGATL